MLTVTAFTIAHSITLVAASLGWVRVPSAPVEAVIALSIVFVALEVMRSLAGQEGLTARQPLAGFVLGGGEGRFVPGLRGVSGRAAGLIWPPN